MTSLGIGTQLRPKQIALLGTLMALQLILSRFSIGGDLVRVGFTFLATAMMGYYFGPIWAGVGTALTDLAGAFLFPHGAFFIGFTVSAFIGGFIYGIMLHNQKITIVRCLITTLISIVVVSMLLNSWWLNIMYHTPIIPMLETRLLKNVILLPIQTFLIFGLLGFEPVRKSLARFGQ